jgi:hypothetical protein
MKIAGIQIWGGECRKRMQKKGCQDRSLCTWILLNEQNNVLDLHSSDLETSMEAGAMRKM